MEYMIPNFTKDMVKTHKILIPNMAVTQFRLMQAALASEGYQTEVLGNCGSEVAQLGLKYVHNDTCYPALLVIGQFLDALNSGKYDLDHTALLITQTGGGCRASNYIKLLRKALVKAGYGNIPVASLNFSGLEKGSGLPLTVPLLRKVIASIFYGDMLVALRSQTHAYENHRGDADAMTEKWISTIQGWIRDDKNYSAHDMKRRFYDIAADYATIPITRVPKVKVGVVGEIYVKYSPLGNNDLEKFLESQDCEVNLPGLMGFVEYCVANYKLDIDLYGGNKLVAGGADAFLSWLDGIGCASYDAMRKYGFYAPGSFRELMKKPEGIISLGAKMGEGWLLTAEMIELVEGGYGNIVCAQPFGCLPNHIVGKGMINKIRALHPDANITPVDYDPSATRVNQENRIKLMLAVAKERLTTKADPAPVTAEELAGKTIAVTRGAVEDMELTKIAPASTEIRRFEDNSSTIAAYLSGQVQMVATGNVVAASINGQNPAKKLEVKFLIKNSPCYIGLNKNQPELQKAVDDIITQAKKDGQLEAIAQTWLHTSLPKDF